MDNLYKALITTLDVTCTPTTGVHIFCPVPSLMADQLWGGMGYAAMFNAKVLAWSQVVQDIVSFAPKYPPNKFDAEIVKSYEHFKGNITKWGLQDLNYQNIKASMAQH